MNSASGKLRHYEEEDDLLDTMKSSEGADVTSENIRAYEEMLQEQVQASSSDESEEPIRTRRDGDTMRTVHFTNEIVVVGDRNGTELNPSEDEESKASEFDSTTLLVTKSTGRANDGHPSNDVELPNRIRTQTIEVESPDEARQQSREEDGGSDKLNSTYELKTPITTTLTASTEVANEEVPEDLMNGQGADETDSVPLPVNSKPKIDLETLERSEISLTIVEINCNDVMSQDFCDLVEEVNNVEIAGKYFIVSSLTTESVTKWQIDTSSIDNHVIIIHDAENWSKSLDLLRGVSGKLRTEASSTIICGIAPNGRSCESYEMSQFCCQNGILQTSCVLTFSDVSRVLKWVIRHRYDCNRPRRKRSHPIRKTEVPTVLPLNKKFEIAPADPQKEFDYFYSICLMGPPQSGKTQILRRFIEDTHNENYVETLGMEFNTKSVTLDDKAINMQIWDMGGDERFRSITYNYFSRTHCLLCVLDLSDRHAVEKLRDHMKQSLPIDVNFSHKVLGIVCNKSDVNRQKPGYESRLNALAIEVAADFTCEISARTGKGVEQLFVQCCHFIRRLDQRSATSPSPMSPVRKTGAFPHEQPKSSFCSIL